MYYIAHWLNETPNQIASHKDGEITNESAKCLKRYFPNSEES